MRTSKLSVVLIVLILIILVGLYMLIFVMTTCGCEYIAQPTRTAIQATNNFVDTAVAATMTAKVQ